ncbi:hypothetical protein BDN72DRAFT_297057 [Pluteus cervinus]|uniref:Uncharacterized protein n=1 Tax=Pluteus cervinus TaxID=181527 RepID=A0ACD3B562_9AGAR|nr:hypothetical protein BDN72DRAFT_297057 [Pluteus cervinus]
MGVPRNDPIFPNEILALVFEWGSFSPTGPPFEILISQVSQHWRAVALATPKLWRSVRFTLGRISKMRASSYLKRSASYPLHVTCVFRPRTREETPTSEADFLVSISQLLANVHRLQRLRVVCQDGTQMVKLISEARDLCAPILEVLDITVLEGGCPPHNSGTRIFKNGSPKLHVVRVAEFPLSKLVFPLQRITHLEICTLSDCNRRISYAFFIAMLKDLHSLQLLALSNPVFPNVGWPALSDKPSVILRHLKTLSLKDSETTLRRYLLAIDAPILQELILHDLCHADLEAPFVRANYPSIQSITLDNPSLSLESLDYLHQFFPIAKHLCILQADPETLSSLLVQDGHDDLKSSAWTHLQTITLAPAPESMTSLLRLATGRKLVGHALETIILPLPDQLDNIEDLREHVNVVPFLDLTHEPYRIRALEI